SRQSRHGRAGPPRQLLHGAGADAPLSEGLERLPKLGLWLARSGLVFDPAPSHLECLPEWGVGLGAALFGGHWDRDRADDLGALERQAHAIPARWDSHPRLARCGDVISAESEGVAREPCGSPRRVKARISTR